MSLKAAKRIALLIAAIVFVASPLNRSAQALSIQWPADSITEGQILHIGEFMVSQNQGFHAVLLPNGHFAVYKGSGPGDDYGVVWNTDRTVPGGKYFAILQDDGNFVVYKGTGPSDNQGVVWNTTVSGPKGHYFATMQDDGNFAIYKGTPSKPNGHLWSVLRNPIPVTWMPHGKFVHHVGDNYGDLYYGINPADTKYKVMRVWMNRRNFAQKYGILPDGTWRWAGDTSMCMSYDTKMLQYNWRELFLTMAKCSLNLQEQKGWSYSSSDHTIRNSNYPKGCLFSTYDGLGWKFPQFSLEYCHGGDTTKWELE